MDTTFYFCISFAFVSCTYANSGHTFLFLLHAPFFFLSFFFSLLSIISTVRTYFQLVKSWFFFCYFRANDKASFCSVYPRDSFYAPILHRSVQISLIIIIIVINNNNNDNSNNGTDNVNNIPFTLIKRVRYTQLNRKIIVAGVLLKIPYL